MKYVTITIRAVFADDVTTEEIDNIAAHAWVQVEEPDGEGIGEQTLDASQYEAMDYTVNAYSSECHLMLGDLADWQEAAAAIESRRM